MMVRRKIMAYQTRLQRTRLNRYQVTLGFFSSLFLCFLLLNLEFREYNCSSKYVFLQGKHESSQSRKSVCAAATRSSWIYLRTSKEGFRRPLSVIPRKAVMILFLVYRSDSFFSDVQTTSAILYPLFFQECIRRKWGYFNPLEREVWSSSSLDNSWDIWDARFGDDDEESEAHAEEMVVKVMQNRPGRVQYYKFNIQNITPHPDLIGNP